MYYTYVLKSRVDNLLYIGWTPDLKKRVEFHNRGKVNATKARRPLELVYYEACQLKEKAIKREKYFKTGFGRRFLKERTWRYCLEFELGNSSMVERAPLEGEIGVRVPVPQLRL